MVAVWAPQQAKAFQAPGDWLTVVLPRSADACYRLFCDIARVPEWLPVVATSVITQRDVAGRAKKVAFQASLRRATIGYSCLYRYRAEERMVSWATPARASFVVRGMAQFQPLAAGSCLMTYALGLRIGRGLPAFADTTFATHASSAALAQFAAFARAEIVLSA
jgi:ribosome-associated toxin RatA of RatAB toxin-antitoxin module